MYCIYINILLNQQYLLCVNISIERCCMRIAHCMDCKEFLNNKISLRDLSKCSTTTQRISATVESMDEVFLNFNCMKEKIYTLYWRINYQLYLINISQLNYFHDSECAFYCGLCVNMTLKSKNVVGLSQMWSWKCENINIIADAKSIR